VNNGAMQLQKSKSKHIQNAHPHFSFPGLAISYKKNIILENLY